MNLLLLTVITYFVVYTLSPATCIPCNAVLNSSNYTAFETMLLIDRNLIELENTFFPTNSHFSVVVDVHYHFLEVNSDVAHGQPEKRTRKDFTVQNLSDDEIYKDNLQQNSGSLKEEIEFVVKFRWSSSPINLYMRPDLLQRLSLTAYRTDVPSIHLYLQAPCQLDEFNLIQPDDIINSTCVRVPQLLQQLNIMTANLKSYALHRSSVVLDGMQLDKEKGFSVYFFGLDNPSHYCVIDQEDEYSEQRLYMNFGAMLLIFAIMFLAPLMLVATYDSFRDRINKDRSKNWRCFVWGIVTVSAASVCIMLGYDIATIIYNIEFYPSNSGEIGFHDIFMYFILFGAVLGVMLAGDFIFITLGLVYIKPVGDRVFPIPELFRFIKSCPCRCLGYFCRGGCYGARREEPQGDEPRSLIGRLCCSECLVLLFGSFSFTLFLQCSSFHSVYILLGVISTPVETLSITAFFIASFFFLTVFTAMFLKLTDNRDLYNPKCTSTNLLKCLLALFVGCLFIGCSVPFVMYFYNYITMVQNYRNDGGYLAILGSSLPSVFLSAGGWVGTKLINGIKPFTAVRQPRPDPIPDGTVFPIDL